jgi:N-acetylneuraminate synthase
MSKSSIQLGHRLISQDGLPYLIAEIGVNHGGSLEQAKRLIELAKQGGADAVKFQSYKADTLASKHSPAYWDTTEEPTTSQHELFAKYDSFGPDDYAALAEHCEQVGIDFVSTPFDDASADFLEPLVPFYKVASADLTNLPFLGRIAAKGKPVLLSTGASTLGEIDIAVDTLSRAGCHDIVLLHCILNYPTDLENAHLRMITGLKRAYPDRIIGYSDHTVPDANMLVLTVASLLGAVVIEKHFTHDKSLPGNDHYHAMDVDDLARFVDITHQVSAMFGPTDHKAPIPSEEISRLNARRSIVLARDVSVGQVLTEPDLICKRPGTGISPLHWDEVLGQKATMDLQADDLLRWRDVSTDSQ